jgi:cellulose synthase/poly-beta-1,6-N-acetylglucosamine synthase-like glycosyltransferase
MKATSQIPSPTGPGPNEEPPDQPGRPAPHARRGAGLVLALVLAGLVTAFVCWPIGALQATSAVLAIVFLGGTASKFGVCLAGMRRERYRPVTDDDLAALREEDLPVYTVLAPLFREADVAGQLIKNVMELDYPVSKLEVLLLLETGDAETLRVTEEAGLPPYMRVIVVPPGEPQTKARACNVGLSAARGDHLVCYDAADKPDLDQLKKAVVAFRGGGELMACVQAALNYRNVRENFLARMFTAEYSFWYDCVLPGLDAFRLPVPLGGNSSHFRTEALRRLGGWNPFGSTDDADRGIRAAALGYTTGVINSTTTEDARRNLGDWMRLRSALVEADMQTAVANARNLWSLMRVAGLRRALGLMMLTTGSSVASLFLLPLWTLLAASLLIPARTLGLLYPDWTLLLGLFSLLAGNSLMIYVTMLSAFLRQREGQVLWSLFSPFCWILHSIASQAALWQLITRPNYWEKTTYGISALCARPDPASASVPAQGVVR